MSVNNYKSPIATEGLVFSIDSNNVVGSTAPTTTQNIFNGTQSGSFINGCSIIDGDYEFDGVDDRIEFPLIPDIDFDKNDLFTYELWYNAASSSVEVLYSTTKTDSSGGISIQMINGKPRFVIHSNENIARFNTRIVDDLPTLNEWHQVVFVKNASGLDLSTALLIYVDGVLVNSTVDNNLMMVTDTIQSGQPSWIGSRQFGASPLPYEGLISKLCVYDRAIDANEVIQNYVSQKDRFQ